MEAQCSKCNNNRFEVRLVGVQGLDDGIHMIVCTKCLATAGVAEHQSMESHIQNIISQLYTISQRIDKTTSDQQYTFNHKINELATELINIKYQLSLR